MIQKKVCMIGAYAVGKTSLVRRFVSASFDERYQTTVGVTLEKKTLQVDGKDVMLMIWDIEGEDDFAKIRQSHLRGASGFFLVADGCRRATLDVALDLKRRMGDAAPLILLINKEDRRPEWEIDPEEIERLERDGWTVLLTSAKTGARVEEAFLSLARQMLTGNL